VLRYNGLIAVSGRSADKLEDSVSAIEQAAVQASCETKRLAGQQAQGVRGRGATVVPGRVNGRRGGPHFTGLHDPASTHVL
jgi:hypothetical protein